MILLGYNITKAVATTKVMNFTSNVVALIVFLFSGHVILYVGLTMALGQIIGARLGSSLAMRKGAGFIKPIFLSLVLIIMLRLFYINYFIK